MLTLAFIFANNWCNTQRIAEEKESKSSNFSLFKTKFKRLKASSIGRLSLDKKSLNRTLLEKVENRSILSKYKIDLEYYSPWILITLARIGIFTISYTYHSKQSLAHLSWLLLSFMIPLKLVFTLTIWLIFPLLFLEFYVMYILNIPMLFDPQLKAMLIKDYFLFQQFYFEFRVPSLELGILYVLLLIFTLMIAAKRILDDETDYLKEAAFKRMKSSHTSILWKFFFFFLKTVHTLALFMLFVMGMFEMNLYHLGLMFFFVVYSASQDLYRKTSVLLIIFTSFFIWGQYFYSLVCLTVNQDMHKQLFQIFEAVDWAKDECIMKNTDDVYFIITPEITQWIVLLVVVALQFINNWFKDQKRVHEMDIICDNEISKRFPNASKIYKRTKYIFQEILVFTLLIVMTLIEITQEPTLITWGFLFLSFLILGKVLTSSGTQIQYSKCIRYAKVLKFYAAFTLIVSVSYFLITKPGFLDQVSIDEQIYDLVPWLFDNIEVIGFTAYISDNEHTYQIWLKFATQLAFLFIGYLLENFYLSMKEQKTEEEEADYSKVYQDHFELEKYYEKIRFTIPFLLYKTHKQWNILDNIALYFHIVTNTFILYIAINIELSLFMAFNIACIVLFYVYASINLDRNSKRLDYNESVELTLEEAKAESKSFKRQASQSFLNIRIGLWYCQYFILLAALLCIYPSSLIGKYIQATPLITQYTLDLLNSAAFYMFWGGVYASKSDQDSIYYVLPAFTLLVLLILEKHAQKWLINRFGCTIDRIVKYKEIEERLAFYKKHKQLPTHESTFVDKKYEFVTYAEAKSKIQEVKDKFLINGISQRSQLNRKQKIIDKDINTKYAIDAAKGTRLIFEQISIFLLMASSVAKANVISLVYTFCVILYTVARRRNTVMPYIVTIIGLCFIAQYSLALINLTSMNSPRRFPNIFQDYPSEKYPIGEYIFPFFLQFDFFRTNVKWTYFLAMGIESKNLQSLYIDFINLWVVAMYFLLFRNPVLSKHVKKVLFWRKDVKSSLVDMEQSTFYDALKSYTQLFAQENQGELDISTQHKLREAMKELLKERKMQNLNYLQAKRVSYQIYLTQHIVTLVGVFFLALLNRSIVSLGYVIILLPYFFSTSDYLKQYKLKQWSFIVTVSVYLLYFSILDFSINIICQMPPLDYLDPQGFWGLRRPYEFTEESSTINEASLSKDTTYINLVQKDLIILLLKCAIQFLISFQREIFRSDGYKSFINKKGLSQLMVLRKDKQKAIAYNFNNQKLKHIVAINKEKQSIFDTVNQLKLKIKLWKQQHYFQVAPEQLIGELEQEKGQKQNKPGHIKNLIAQVNQAQKEAKKQEKLIVAESTRRKTLGMMSMFSSVMQKHVEEEIRLDESMVKKIAKAMKAQLPMKAQFFNWLSKDYTDQILFITKHHTMQRVMASMEAGEKEVKTIINLKIDKDVRSYIRKCRINNVEINSDNLKIDDLRATQEFLEPWNLFKQTIFLFVKMIASNTNTIAYILMIAAMYQNAGLLALIYPLAVFGYAMLEETRPKKEFWNFILKYTLVVLMLKFSVQLSIFSQVADFIKTFNTWTKVGLVPIEAVSTLAENMMFEIFIILAILGNNIKETLQGLNKVNETQVEDIKSAIYRNLKSDGNSDADLEFLKQQFLKYKERRNQNAVTPKRFIQNNQEYQKDYQELNNDVEEKTREVFGKQLEEYSFCFDMDELEQKIHQVSSRRKEKKSDFKGFFESITYFDRIFPSTKAQKPGKDKYLQTTFTLFSICLFIFFYYNDINPEGIMDEADTFEGSMVIFLFIHVGIIIFERFISRSDTKKVQKKEQILKAKFKHIKRQSQTATVTRMAQLQVDNLTKEQIDDQQDLKSGAAQDMLLKLKDLEKNQKIEAIQIEKTKITVQQKCKYILHWLLLILVHILVFWYFPIYGNLSLYETAECPYDAPYGCRTFAQNWALVFLYTLYCIYFAYSALQIKYGLPQFKRASSTMGDSDLSQLCHGIYVSLPFILELRTILDWSFTKTSLDIFQWMQLNYYHSDFYIASIANRNYMSRKLGTKISKLEKCLCGCCLSFLLLFFIIGPFLLFSNLGVVADYNPVKQSTFEVNLKIQQPLDLDNPDRDFTKLFNLYGTNTPKMYSVDPDLITNEFVRHPELKFFDEKQIQTFQLNKFSDSNWIISDSNRDQLKDIFETYLDQYDKGTESQTFKLFIEMRYSFVRDAPDDALIASGFHEQYIDPQTTEGLQSIKDIIDILSMDCKTTNVQESKNTTFKGFVPKLIHLNDAKEAAVIELKKFTRIDAHQLQDQENESAILKYYCRDEWALVNDKDEEIQIFTFSSRVVGGFIASYDVTTFYISIVLAIGTLIRPIFIFITPRAFIYECSHPQPIMKLCESVHLMRHEQQLEKEEEYHLMLVEIVRSPELLKALTGSSLKGELGQRPQQVQER